MTGGGFGPPPGDFQPGGAPGWNPAPRSGGGTGPGGGDEQGPADPAASALKNRKPLIITAIATVVVLVVAGAIVGVLLNMRGGEDPNRPPNNAATDVAKAYLQALSRGDAQAALDLSATQPASTELLTNDILKKQIEKLPITDIEIIGNEPDPDQDKRTTKVHVAAKFGGQRTEGKLDMVVSDGQWKMGAAFVNGSTDIGGFRGSKLSTTLSGEKDGEDVESILTVFGKPLPGSRHFYVFPGYLEVGTSVAGIGVNNVAPTTLDEVTPYSTYYLDAKFGLNDDGKKAVDDAIRAWLQKCFSPGPKTGACAAVAAKWDSKYDKTSTQLRGPVDLSKLQYELEYSSTVVRVSGDVPDVPITISENGQPFDATVNVEAPNVDLGKNPPAIVDPSS